MKAILVMEMPESCMECKQRMVCDLKESEDCDEELGEKFPLFCPLIPMSEEVLDEIFGERDETETACLEEIQQYRAIGTVEECREAMKKQKEKKPNFEINLGDCTSIFSCGCGKRILVKHDRGVMNNHDAPNYCSVCGQKLDWGE